MEGMKEDIDGIKKDLDGMKRNFDGTKVTMETMHIMMRIKRNIKLMKDQQKAVNYIRQYNI